MSMRLLVPKVLPRPGSTIFSRPFFFLAGPVRGGGDWQADMSQILHKKVDDFTAAIPCRWGDDHPLTPHFVIGVPFDGRQTSWERLLLHKAALRAPYGCIIFYLARQVGPRPPEQGVYARDTLGEIGEWRGRMMHSAVRMVIGADPDFDPNGVDIMQRNFTEALGYEFPIYKSMEETADAAIRLINQT
jgi:hypothetical protein